MWKNVIAEQSDDGGDRVRRGRDLTGRGWILADQDQDLVEDGLDDRREGLFANRAEQQTGNGDAQLRP